MAQGMWNRMTEWSFDRWAPGYREAVEPKLRSRGYSYDELGDQVWRAMDTPSAGTIVELGCGPGIVGAALKPPPPVRLIGVDISGAMLSQADPGIYSQLIQA